MDTWKVTFTYEGITPISVNVKSNNEHYARENGKRKLLMQYADMVKGRTLLNVKCKRLTDNRLVDRIITGR